MLGEVPSTIQKKKMVDSSVPSPEFKVQLTPLGVAPAGGDAFLVGHVIDALLLGNANRAQVAFRALQVEVTLELEKGAVAVDLVGIPFGVDIDTVDLHLHLGALVLRAIMLTAQESIHGRVDHVRAVHAVGSRKNLNAEKQTIIEYQRRNISTRTIPSVC